MLYKQTENIVLRKIGDVYLLVPVKRIEGIEVSSFLALNQTGGIIWECLNEATTVDAITATLAKRFSLNDDMLLQLKDDITCALQALVEARFAQRC